MKITTKDLIGIISYILLLVAASFIYCHRVNFLQYFVTIACVVLYGYLRYTLGLIKGASK